MTQYSDIGKDFQIYRDKKIFLFGASSAAEKIMRDFNAYEIEVEALVDNDEKKAGKKFLGKSIITFSELKKRIQEKSAYIIQISSSYEKEIGAQLEEIGANYITYTEYYNHIWGRTKHVV